MFHPEWEDNLIPDWEQDENYTKGAVLIVGRYDIAELNKFLDNAKKDTKDNVFALETSLCAVEKFRKGTRYNGYYTERMLNEAAESPKYGNLIITLAK